VLFFCELCGAWVSACFSGFVVVVGFCFLRMGVCWCSSLVCFVFLFFGFGLLFGRFLFRFAFCLSFLCGWLDGWFVVFVLRLFDLWCGVVWLFLFLAFGVSW